MDALIYAKLNQAINVKEFNNKIKIQKSVHVNKTIINNYQIIIYNALKNVDIILGLINNNKFVNLAINLVNNVMDLDLIIVFHVKKVIFFLEYNRTIYKIIV